MAGMAVRDFECILCGQPFQRMSADFILLEDQICEGCLEALWRLTGEALQDAVSTRLVQNRALLEKKWRWNGDFQPLGERIVLHLQGLQAKWQSYADYNAWQGRFSFKKPG